MESDRDRLYYARRAQTERARAEVSTDKAAAVAHLAMAAEYERRAMGTATGPVLAAQSWSAPGQERSLH
ncbi:hypothetical protein [Sphingomonas sp. OTU376]|uniref:hypothetical protein n=1 Tax=Sphingomonas sp. OTU376 TaxID=3043863 RepID=UPI00313D19D0